MRYHGVHTTSVAINTPEININPTRRFFAYVNFISYLACAFHWAYSTASILADVSPTQATLCGVVES